MSLKKDLGFNWFNRTCIGPSTEYNFDDEEDGLDYSVARNAHIGLQQKRSVLVAREADVTNARDCDEFYNIAVDSPAYGDDVAYTGVFARCDDSIWGPSVDLVERWSLDGGDGMQQVAYEKLSYADIALEMEAMEQSVHDLMAAAGGAVESHIAAYGPEFINRKLDDDYKSVGGTEILASPMATSFHPDERLAIVAHCSQGSLPVPRKPIPAPLKQVQGKLSSLYYKEFSNIGSLSVIPRGFHVKCNGAPVDGLVATLLTLPDAGSLKNFLVMDLLSDQCLSIHSRFLTTKLHYHPHHRPKSVDFSGYEVVVTDSAQCANDHYLVSFLAVALHNVLKHGSVVFRVTSLLAPSLVFAIGLALPYFSRAELVKPSQSRWWDGEYYVVLAGRNARCSGLDDLVATFSAYGGGGGEMPIGSIKAAGLCVLGLRAQLYRLRLVSKYLFSLVEGRSGVEWWMNHIRYYADRARLHHDTRVDDRFPVNVELCRTVRDVALHGADTRVAALITAYFRQHGYLLDKFSFPPPGFVKGLAKYMDVMSDTTKYFWFATYARFGYAVKKRSLTINCKDKQFPLCLRGVISYTQADCDSGFALFVGAFCDHITVLGGDRHHVTCDGGCAASNALKQCGDVEENPGPCRAPGYYEDPTLIKISLAELADIVDDAYDDEAEYVPNMWVTLGWYRCALRNAGIMQYPQ